MKLSYSKTFYVGLAFMIICMFWQVYDNIIVKMLINSFGFNQTWSGVIMTFDNVLALFMLPLFGVISDRTRTKYGKRIPFIFWGVIISAILFVGVAVVDSKQQELVEAAGISEVVTITKDNGDVVYEFDGIEYVEKEKAADARAAVVMEVTKNNILYIILFVVALLVVLIVMATYRTPAVSLMPDVTPKPLRSKANAVINLMGSVGGIISLGLMFFFAVDYQSYVMLFIVLAISMIFFLAIFIWRVNEPRLVREMEAMTSRFKEETNEKEEVYTGMSPEVKASFIFIMTSIVLWFMAYNAATTKFSDYAGNVLDMGFTMPLLVAQGVAIIFFIPIGIISSKVGRKKTIMVGISILFFAFVLGSIATAKTAMLIYVTMGLAGIGWASINVNSYPMVVEMSRGHNIGKFTGYYYTASMAAQIATPIISGLLMDFIGRRVLFIYSALFCVLAFLTMIKVRHGDSKPIAVKSIEAYESFED